AAFTRRPRRRPSPRHSAPTWTRDSWRPTTPSTSSARARRAEVGCVDAARGPASRRGLPAFGRLESPRLAAVDGDARAGDPAGAGRAEEGDHVGHLLGATEAAGGDLAVDESGDPRRIALLAAVPAAAGEEDRAGRHAQDPDVLAGQLAAHGLGQADLAGLGHVVAGAAASLAAVDGRDHHDHPAAAGAQV